MMCNWNAKKLAHILFFLPIWLYSQPDFQQLLDYQGLYEYTGNTELIMAVSPMDTTLYAIIDGAKYPLKYLEKDRFADMSKTPVNFHLENERVVSYELNGQLFQLITKEIDIPEMLPHPELYYSPEQYNYQIPQNLGDGIETGSLEEVFGHPDLIKEMVRKTFSGVFPDVHSILIYRQGKLVLEEYFYGYDRMTPHQLRSATKSFLGSLVGIAIERKEIGSEHDKLLPYFQSIYPEIKCLDTLKQQITIEDFLTYRHGLDCDNKNPESQGNEISMMESKDWVKFTLDLPMEQQPGKSASYCTGAALTIGRLVELATGEKVEDYARERLFSPMGIYNYKWEFAPDPSSKNTFCQMYLTPRDLVKLAIMYLNGGYWRGRQILPRNWVRKTFAKHDPEFGYLWRHQYLVIDGKKYNAYLATGNGGQKIHIWPDLEMITVFTGGNYNSYLLYGKSTAPNQMIPEYILPAISVN